MGMKRMRSIPHESPLTMLIPLGVLAVGALFAGLVFSHEFIGEGGVNFGKARYILQPGNHILEAREGVPEFAKQLPTVLMVFGFFVAVLFYILAPSIPGRLAQVTKPLYEFLLNKWYFDELYDLIFVRPAFWLGRLFWKGGDGAIIDRLGPDGVAARVVDVTGRVVKLQSGYIYHYAFAMLVGLAAVDHLVCGRGSPLMFGFGILSCIVFLPLAGAGFILALRGDDEATLGKRAPRRARHDRDRLSLVALCLCEV